MDPNALILARLQFAFTISFHIIFPAFSIGLSAYVATLLVLWKRTGKDHFHRLARFWTKIFAVSFAMGVVSGIPLSYQFGTNWARFSEVAGNVIGPLIGYEVLTAFFLEATFLGVMLFGWQRVAPWLHVTAAILVALGTAISGFWILAANSWMHTPDGYSLHNGIAYPESWLHVIFNPSFPYRFAHMMTAAYLTTSVVVLAAGARYLIRSEFETEGRTMMRMGVGMLAILGPLQMLLGDQHGLNTLQYEPAKIAAIEAHWDDDGPADLVLFALPDEVAERNRAEIAVPHLGSMILTHKWDGRFAGLKDFPRNQRPPVTSIFFAFRLMVAIGLTLVAIGLVGAVLWWRNKLFTTKWYLHIVARAWWLGFIAILAGWLTTESGRQPYVVYGILRTEDALSPVSSAVIATSLTLFVLVYCVVFSIGIFYIHRLIWNGPKGAAVKPAALPEGLPNRPLSVADRPTRETSGKVAEPPGQATHEPGQPPRPFEAGARPAESDTQPPHGGQLSDAGAQPRSPGGQSRDAGAQPRDPDGQSRDSSTQPRDPGAQPRDSGGQLGDSGAQPRDSGGPSRDSGAQPSDPGGAQPPDQEPKP